MVKSKNLIKYLRLTIGLFLENLSFFLNLLVPSILTGSYGFEVIAFTALFIVPSLSLAVIDPGPPKYPFTPILRLEHPARQIRLSPKGDYLAYEQENGLRILDLRSKDYVLATNKPIGGSFTFTPDGRRIIYRELFQVNGGAPQSNLVIYDLKLRKNILLETLHKATGPLTLDPRDLRVHYLYDQGIRTKKLLYPDNRLAKWQHAQMIGDGKWLAAQKGMLWITMRGHAMQQIDDDNSGIATFDISPDGDSAVWETKAGRIFFSHSGAKAKSLGFGHHPSWHPKGHGIVFSGARMVGRVIRDYDLKFSDREGRTRFITNTPFSQETAPAWDPDGHKVYYSRDKTTDVYLTEIKS